MKLKNLRLWEIFFVTEGGRMSPWLALCWVYSPPCKPLFKSVCHSGRASSWVNVLTLAASSTPCGCCFPFTRSPLSKYTHKIGQLILNGVGADDSWQVRQEVWKQRETEQSPPPPKNPTHMHEWNGKNVKNFRWSKTLVFYHRWRRGIKERDRENWFTLF